MKRKPSYFNHFAQKKLYAMMAIFSILAFLSIEVQAQENSDPDVVLAGTYGIGYLFEPFGDVDTEADLGELVAAIEEIREEHENALIVQMGELLTPGMILETGYDSMPTNFIEENEYDLLHYSTKDYVTGHSHGYGTKKRNASTADEFIMTGIDFQHFNLPNFPLRQTIEKGELAVQFGSLASKELVKSIPSSYEQAIVDTPAQINSNFEVNLDAANILFIEVPDQELVENLREIPNADLAINLNPKVTLTPTTFEIPVMDAPSPHEILLIKGFESEAGEWTWETELRPWTTEERFETLTTPDLPQIGVSIPANNRVAELLDIDPLAVTLEVFREQEHQDLTKRNNIYVYQVEYDETKYRVYRLLHDLGTFWIYFDGLIVVNPDHTLRQIYVHNKNLPYHSQPTTLFDALNTLVSKTVSEFPDELPNVEGIDNQADIIFQSVENVLELDRRLYSED